MNAEAVPLEPRFAAGSPDPVDEEDTAPVEPPPVLQDPGRTHSPISEEAAPLEPHFAADSPDPVESPPLLTSPGHSQVSYAGDSCIRPHSQMSI